MSRISSCLMLSTTLWSSSSERKGVLFWDTNWRATATIVVGLTQTPWLTARNTQDHRVPLQNREPHMHCGSPPSSRGRAASALRHSSTWSTGSLLPPRWAGWWNRPSPVEAPRDWTWCAGSEGWDLPRHMQASSKSWDRKTQLPMKVSLSTVETPRKDVRPLEWFGRFYGSVHFSVGRFLVGFVSFFKDTER